jgi:hypothetical protein
VTLYAGETLAIAATILDPVTGVQITTGTVTADFFAPPKDPSSVVADRATVDHTAALTYGTKWTGTISSTGWAPGVWWMRVSIAGTYAAWVYQSFTIAA